MTAAAREMCAARRQGTAGGNDPVDCDWPLCGCDGRADQVIVALIEAGWESPERHKSEVEVAVKIEREACAAILDREAERREAISRSYVLGRRTTAESHGAKALREGATAIRNRT